MDTTISIALKNFASSLRSSGFIHARYRSPGAGQARLQVPHPVSASDTPHLNPFGPGTVASSLGLTKHPTPLRPPGATPSPRVASRLLTFNRCAWLGGASASESFAPLSIHSTRSVAAGLVSSNGAPSPRPPPWVRMKCSLCEAQRAM